MPYCAVLECKNASKNKNLKNSGVSFHRFPKNPYTAEKWINATGRRNWMPNKISTICSEHFDDKYIDVSQKGYRRIIDERAAPTLKIVVFHEDQNKADPGPPIKREKSTTEEIGKQNDSETVSKSPTNKKLKIMLLSSQTKIRQRNLKIKRLQGQNRRLRMKLDKVEGILRGLKNKLNDDLLHSKNTGKHGEEKANESHDISTTAVEEISIATSTSAVDEILKYEFFEEEEDFDRLNVIGI